MSRKDASNHNTQCIIVTFNEALNTSFMM